MPYNQILEFIEASAFTRHVYEYLSEDEYLGLQSFLFQHPEVGDEIWLLTIYSKSETENIPAHILRQIAKEIENV